MADDPLRLFDAKDVAAAALYAKRVASSQDLYPILVNADGSLIVSITSGTISVTTSTKVTIDNTHAVTVINTLTVSSVSITASTTVTGTVTTNVVGGNINISSATLGTVTTVLSSTVVTVHFSPSASLATVSLSSTAVTVSNTAGTVTNSVSTIMLLSKTLTGSTGSVNTTNTSISLTPAGKIKVYAFSLTTTSASEVTCIFHSGSVSNGLELWRATLMAPAGTNAGANLAIAPPSFLFASRSGTAVSLSLSTAVLVHYTISYFDEA